ncbi:MAG: hypothetical protein ABR564_07705 [Candidatus Dormibacteria bacterium]
MATEKVSLSLDAGLLDEARRRSGGGNLSRYVTEGLRRQVLADRQADLLGDWERQFGPIPEELVAEMDALWPD